jgi:ABC-type transport system involved in multi-copper enzyme maturation permease subunit
MVHAWILVAGGFAAVGLLAWLVKLLLRGRGPERDEHPLSWTMTSVIIVLGGVLFAALYPALNALWNAEGWSDVSSPTANQGFFSLLGRQFRSPLDVHLGLPPVALDFAAGCALTAVLLPLVLNVARLRWRRIFALAQLSFKEAIRRRVLWVFSILLLVFLFGSWFVKTTKYEDQLSNYVNLVYTVMAVLLLLTAAILSSFSLPGDIRNQTIHTIVTKPVERFEILLGRFLGYAFLMTLVLVVMTLFSLTYVARSIDQEAMDESYKARVPIYGNLKLLGGKNVGYEFEYRQFISVPDNPENDEYAVWEFSDLPRDLAERGGDLGTIPCEFSFEIFRTTKGEENKGINCSFVFENWLAEPGKRPGVPAELQQYREERVALLQQGGAGSDASLAAVNNKLAEKYGFFEILSKEIVDYHTLSVDVPVGLLRNAEDYVKKLVEILQNEKSPKNDRLRAAKALGRGGSYAASAQPVLSDIARGTDRTTDSELQAAAKAAHDRINAGVRPAPTQVVVRCESKTQYLGVARYDLYLLDATRPFEPNFFKGIVGLWYLLLIVIGLAVTVSTFLSGVISFLVTMAFLLGGLFKDWITSLAEGKVPGGGPFEAALRLGPKGHPSIPLDPTPVVSFAQTLDKGFQAILQPVLKFIPDVNRYDWTNFVAEGFDISGGQLVLTGILWAGYLLPWFVLGFYLIRSREVAS